MQVLDMIISERIYECQTFGMAIDEVHINCQKKRKRQSQYVLYRLSKTIHTEGNEKVRRLIECICNWYQ